MKTSLVILTDNELSSLEKTFHSIPQNAVDEIIAIDGGSTDGTVEFLKKHKIPVYSHALEGHGDTVRIAFKEANGDAVIFHRPTGNQDAHDIPKFRPFLENGADMVIANRMSDGGSCQESGISGMLSRALSIVLTVAANVTWNRGRYVSDTLSDYRAIRRDACRYLLSQDMGEMSEYQICIRAFKQRLKIKEFPTFEGKPHDSKKSKGKLTTFLLGLKSYFRELTEKG